MNTMIPFLRCLSLQIQLVSKPSHKSRLIHLSFAHFILVHFLTTFPSKKWTSDGIVPTATLRTIGRSHYEIGREGL
ncbi:hypothetical protein ABKN59_011872 [Abortiporus biennis]